MDNLSNLTTGIIAQLQLFADCSVNCIVAATKSKAADATAATAMLQLQRGLVEANAGHETILDTYRFGLKECRARASLAYDEGTYVLSKPSGETATDRKTAGQSGAQRMTTYAKHLALISWAINEADDKTLAKDAVAPGKSTMAERKATLERKFDSALLQPSKLKVKMVKLDDREWDLNFVENLPDDDQALLGFTASSDTVNRELGSTYKKVQHQISIAKLRAKHNNSAITRWQKALGLREVSGNG